MMSRRIKFNDSFNGENIVNETKEINWEAEEVLSVEKFVNKEKKIVNG